VLIRNYILNKTEDHYAKICFLKFFSHLQASNLIQSIQIQTRQEVERDISASDKTAVRLQALRILTAPAAETAPASTHG